MAGFYLLDRCSFESLECRFYALTDPYVKPRLILQFIAMHSKETALSIITHRTSYTYQYYIRSIVMASWYGLRIRLVMILPANDGGPFKRLHYV